jgi:ribonuclease HII
MSAYILGSDEVGYGAWAGPLVVCAVAVLKTWTPPAGLTDSKQLSIADRRRLYIDLERLPLELTSVSNVDIDRVGAQVALIEAHTVALLSLLKRFPGADVVVDGTLALPQLRKEANGSKVCCFPRADEAFPVVSAASVIAKVNRDYVMQQYHQQFPHYGWNTNVGYGTKTHETGLREHGVCSLHRQSYRPIKKFLETP